MKLILLPGLDGTGDLFQPFLEAQPDGYTIEVLSYPTTLRGAYADYADRVTAALPESEQYVLVAESFSGPVAIQCASRDSKQLKGLILVATFAASPVPTILPRVTTFLFQHNPVFGFLASKALLGFRPNSVKKLLDRTLSKVDPAVLAHRIQLIQQCDFRNELARITVPALYLTARRDLLIKPASRRFIAAHIPKLYEEAVDGPHLLLQSRPEQSWSAIDSFISKL